MKNIHFSIVACAILTIAGFGGVAAQESDSPLPPLGEPKSFSLPEAETYALRNGMKVTLVPFGKVPKVTLRAVVRVGNLNDGETPWISDLAADMLKEGAGGKSASELATAAAEMGGDVNIGVGLDETNVVMDVLSDSAAEAVALISDILQKPEFPASEYERVQANRLRDLSVAASQPDSIATDAFTKIVYPDHPYSAAVLPEAGMVSGISLDDVKAFHASNFGAARTHLYVVGGFDRKSLKRQIKKSFEKWARGPEALALAPGASLDPQVALLDRPGAVQSTLRLGKRVPMIGDDPALDAAHMMLGGYFSSRITKNIREDKGYTYSPRAVMSREVGASYWAETADVTSEATGASLVEIVKEISDLVAREPSAAELRGVQNYMNGIFVIRLASRGGVAGQLAFVNLHGLGKDWLDKYVARVEGLTPLAVHEAARSHLDVADMSLVVVGDLATVREQIGAVPAFADRLPSAGQ